MTQPITGLLGQLQTFRMSVVDDGGADDPIDISNWQPDASRSSMDSSGVGVDKSFTRQLVIFE